MSGDVGITVPNTWVFHILLYIGEHYLAYKNSHTLQTVSVSSSVRILSTTGI